MSIILRDKNNADLISLIRGEEVGEYELSRISESPIEIKMKTYGHNFDYGSEVITERVGTPKEVEIVVNITYNEDTPQNTMLNVLFDTARRTKYIYDDVTEGYKEVILKAFEPNWVKSANSIVGTANMTFQDITGIWIKEKNGYAGILEKTDLTNETVNGHVFPFVTKFEWYTNPQRAGINYIAYYPRFQLARLPQNITNIVITNGDDKNLIYSRSLASGDHIITIDMFKKHVFHNSLGFDTQNINVDSGFFKIEKGETLYICSNNDLLEHSTSDLEQLYLEFIV